MYRKERNWFVGNKSDISPKSIDGSFYPARDTRYPSTCSLRFPIVRFTRYYTSFNLASLQSKFHDSFFTLNRRLICSKKVPLSLDIEMNISLSECTVIMKTTIFTKHFCQTVTFFSGFSLSRTTLRGQRCNYFNSYSSCYA